MYGTIYGEDIEDIPDMKEERVIIFRKKAHK